MKALYDALLEQLPVILTALTGAIVAFLVYLKTRLSYKKSVVEKEQENLKLQELIANGSYMICPKCGEKIFLTQTKILTGGDPNEVKTKSQSLEGSQDLQKDSI